MYGSVARSGVGPGWWVRPRLRCRVIFDVVWLTLAMSALPCETAAQVSTLGGYTLEGRVVDAVGVVPGADVSLLELNRAAVTDAEGRFRFLDLPPGKFTLGVRLAGYAGAYRSIAVPATAPLVIALAADVRLTEHVTVTAAPWAVKPLETPQQVDVVDGHAIRSEGAGSVSRALDSLPGVASIETNGVLATPVLRGFSEDRVRVLNDGVPLNHQQFSFRHSPNVDPIFAERIEVVRGPASILYGPEAMGGVINVVQPPLPTAHGAAPEVRGRVGLGYGSNTQELRGHAEIEGAFGGLGWRVGGVRARAGDIRTPSAPLDNTDADEMSSVAAVGYSGARGTAALRWHHLSADQGFYQPEGFRLDLTDDLVAGDVHVPTRLGAVELLGAHQINLRKAFPAYLQGEPSVALKLETTTLRAGLQHFTGPRWRGRIAGEYQRVSNTPRAVPDLLPQYRSTTYAAMVYEEARFLPHSSQHYDRAILSFGARWDLQRLTVPPDSIRGVPQGDRRRFDAVTGAAGAVVRLTRAFSLAGNVGRGWRPPHAFQLFANGIHGGVAAVQVGDRNLEEESNTSIDLAARYEGHRARGTVTLYDNLVDRYIYLADSGEQRSTSEGLLPVFQFRQTDASILGIDGSIDIDALRWLNLGIGSSWIRTRNLGSNRPLPLTPASRLTLSVRCRRETLWTLPRPAVGLEVVATGRRAASGPDEPFGTSTSGYAILNLQAGFEIPNRKVPWTVSVTVRNLLNATYTDFLWTYKQFAPNPGRNVRLLAGVGF
jgi:hemoglobin/transferrin/lactoferrin receptor protein